MGFDEVRLSSFRTVLLRVRADAWLRQATLRRRVLRRRLWRWVVFSGSSEGQGADRAGFAER